MEEVVSTDIPESLDILKEIKKASSECLQHARALISKVKERPTSSQNQGMSFLDVKNQLMASYMVNLGFLMDKKTSGQSVKDSPSTDRLVEIRTVLEKMRPIEHKLKYQIQKVVTAYKEGKLDPSDPRKFKPNFEAFSNMPDEESSNDEEMTEGRTESKNKVYVAPKLAPVHYSDDETQEERLKKQEQKKSKQVLRSAMLKEMREQYTDAPIEITESRDLHRIRDNKKMRERTEYEENNFVRLSVSKKESAGMKKLGTISALGALAEFDDFTGADGNTERGSSAKKKETDVQKAQWKKKIRKER